MTTMPSYATVCDVAAGFRPICEDEIAKCAALIEEAGVIVDAAAPNAPETAKRVAVCRMVRRALGDGSMDTPMGATQGTVSALGYSQSWTFGSGSGAGASGELYLGRAEKSLLGIANRIGASNPFGGIC